ncbi:MAG: sulfatase-like hydrolase/transferase, partial [Victivallales bacterium]|nr:sulfatase-like hydrolase/transferase [Victivallales bacterium]
MSKENVLFILTDQWPAWAFSFLGADIATPNIDRLASQGTVFRNAFTSCPLCT